MLEAQLKAKYFVILLLLASRDNNSSTGKRNTEKEKRICSPNKTDQFGRHP